MADMSMWVWRHPKAIGVAGRCIGITDVPLDPRKAKRLARQVQRAARAEGLPRIVVTSRLRRSADVGRCLRRWGWVHRIDPALGELDFGSWDGKAWADIAHAEVDAWCGQFLHHRPGGGESLHDMLTRASSWRGTDAAVIIGHAGWMLARRWLQEGREPPASATDWPAPPAHGERWRIAPSPAGRGLR